MLKLWLKTANFPPGLRHRGAKKHFVVKFKGLEPELPAAPFKRCAVAGSLGFFSKRICWR